MLLEKSQRQRRLLEKNRTLGRVGPFGISLTQTNDRLENDSQLTFLHFTLMMVQENDNVCNRFKVFFVNFDYKMFT